MEDDVLAAIIEVEHEIQAKLADEQRRAAELLDRLQGELEQEEAREAERLAVALKEKVTAAREEALQRADALLQRVGEEARRLDDLGDQVLDAAIRKHLGRIAPGQQL